MEESMTDAAALSAFKVFIFAIVADRGLAEGDRSGTEADQGMKQCSVTPSHCQEPEINLTSVL